MYLAQIVPSIWEHRHVLLSLSQILNFSVSSVNLIPQTCKTVRTDKELRQSFGLLSLFTSKYDLRSTN